MLLAAAVSPLQDFFRRKRVVHEPSRQSSPLFLLVPAPLLLKKVGDLSLKAVHYGTSQSACGSLFQLSCGTVGEELFMTLQFAEPVVTRPVAQAYLRGIADNLRAACGISL